MLKIKTQGESEKLESAVSFSQDTPKPNEGVETCSLPPLTHQNNCRSEYDDLVVLNKSAYSRKLLEVSKPALPPEKQTQIID